MKHMQISNSKRSLLYLLAALMGILIVAICVYCLYSAQKRKYESDVMMHLEEDIREYARRRVMTAVLFEMQVELDGKTAVYSNHYGQIGIESESAKEEQTEAYMPYLGEAFSKADYSYTLQVENEKQNVKMVNWYRVKECNNLKYLIGKDEKGYLSLWKFDYFIEDPEDIFLYGNLIGDIYGFKKAEDIKSIQVIERNETTHLFEFIDSINDPEKIEQIYTVISKMPYNVALNKKVDCNNRFITDHEKGYILFLLKHKDGTESEWFIFDIGTGTLHTWATPYISFNEVLCLEDALLLCDMFNLSVEIVDE